MRRRSTPDPPVHPRMGGEHTPDDGHGSYRIGSSPHGRGTRHMNSAPPDRRRFIPAWAGNTGASDAPCTRPAVHPRMGGEHEQVQINGLLELGSSPHGRGTLVLRGPRRLLVWFIPAWAGNTRPKSPTRPGELVHPRMGGEHSPELTETTKTTGSSPHGRGTRIRLEDGLDVDRFIPAWAGNTFS